MNTKIKRRKNYKQKRLAETKKFLSRLDQKIEKRITHYIIQIDKTYSDSIHK
jgi:hypothetical protein